ncbi:sugar 3,4-ketoisomerase [Chryseobacterium sp.]|uniref:sugar 3,4-ketoisomerase n=1 Tax=Chryseobacterium sp. TaxID=1871047 RepID=UPI00388D0A52
MNYREPQIININRIGSSELGFISIAEEHHNIPFDIKRVYWTYYTPQDVTRGGHAHKDLQQVIFAVSGTITFNLTDQLGNKKTVVLSNPSEGLYLPKLIWRDIHFTHNAVLLCLASEHYSEADYFRDYEDFKNYCNEI